MDHLEHLVGQVRRHLFLVLLLENAFIFGAWWACDTFFDLPLLVDISMVAAVALVWMGIITIVTSSHILQPLKALWQAVLHIAPGNHQVAAPKLQELKIGRELVASLTAQIYQFATLAEHGDTKDKGGSYTADMLAQALPLPLFLLDPNKTVIFANRSAADYLGMSADDIIGKNVYSILNMSFATNSTLDQWLTESTAKSGIATNSWERVRLKIPEQTDKQFDLAAYYNKDNPHGIETMLVLFDHTNLYRQGDQAVDFLALSVHELRTPLTLLRGYIEVFEEELEGKITPEMQDFMHKMEASAQQLTAFVSNILNVARIENDQLVLTLQEENWKQVLEGAVQSLRLRAQVRGIEIECQVADNLPSVGVDRVSIHEVVNNLVDNAIKYSGNGKKIVVNAQVGSTGLVETTIQDWGIGIPASTMPHLFNKFYRDFRNRTQIGGSGLGLYLCKTIVNAHGGQIWVNSNEGQGSTFGFSILPYTQLTKDQKNGDKEIVRGAHGWIKNHSLYRR